MRSKFVNSSGGGIAETLDASYYKGQGFRQGMEREFIMTQSNWDGSQISPTLTEHNANGAQRMPDKENFNCVIGGTMETVVRRLTPLECSRLQGFPEKVDEDGKIIGWVDIGDWVDTQGKVHKEADTPKYKALGNSIAVGYANNQSGFWMILMKRISAQYERSATLGSLFDGIAGFPLAWARYNGAENCRWASEIEPFCIAVTTKHFGDEEKGIEGDIKDFL